MMTIGWNQDALREIARQKAYRKKTHGNNKTEK